MEKGDGIKVIPETTRNYKKVLGLLLTIVISVMAIGGLMVQASSAADDPILFYSSAKAGPNQGWEESPTKGAAITVWGKNIGISRGTSTITVAGVTLDQSSDYAEWGATTNPATAKGMQRITFWLNSSMLEGNSEGIYVTVNGKRSNALPFKIDNTGVIRFLSLNGSESYNGKYATYQGGVNGPWTNFGLTTSKMTPGDFLYMRVGNWTYIHNSGDGSRRYEYIGTPWGEAPINGTDDLRITLTSYPGEVAVFKDSAVRLSSSDYWTFTNLKWDGTYSRTALQMGLPGNYCTDNTDHSVGLDIIGVEFTGPIYHAIQAFGDNFRIVANNFNNLDPSQDSKGTTGYILYMCSGNGRIIKDNELSGGSGWLIHYYDEDRPNCADVGRGSKNVVIEGNLFNAIQKSAYGYNDAVIFASGSVGAIDGLVFKNNILIGDDRVGGSSGFGIEIRDTVSNLEIYNNTLYGFPNGINTDYHPSAINNVVIKNNILYNIVNKDIDVGLGYSDTITIYNNLYESTPYIEDDSDSNPVVGDPQFVNPTGSDFHLQSTSPAIDAGTSDVSSVVTTDYDSNPRPMDGDNDGTAEYDIGAYEYRGVSCSYSVSPPTIKPFGSSVGTGSAGVSSCTPIVPVPIGQRGFPYDPTTTPEASTNPAEAMPIGVGDVATGGDILNIQIGLGQFSGPVDIYGAYMLSTDPDNIYILNPDLTFQVFTVEEIVQALTDGAFPVGVEPWMEKTTGPIDETLFNMPTTGLPPGTYYLYLLITPAGSLDNYYLWRTYFEVIGG